jgi:hypothetical protein
MPPSVNQWRSEPHRPTAVTRTRLSPEPGAGWCSSETLMSPTPCKRATFTRSSRPPWFAAPARHTGRDPAGGMARRCDRHPSQFPPSPYLLLGSFFIRGGPADSHQSTPTATPRYTVAPTRTSVYPRPRCAHQRGMLMTTPFAPGRARPAVHGVEQQFHFDVADEGVTPAHRCRYRRHTPRTGTSKAI